HQRRTYAHYSKAVSLSQEGKLAEAAEEAGAALKEDPGHLPSQKLLDELSAPARSPPAPPGSPSPAVVSPTMTGAAGSPRTTAALVLPTGPRVEGTAGA